MIDFQAHTISSSESLRQALKLINETGTAMTLFVEDDRRKMIGTLTDGDIRRGILNGVSLDDPIASIMHESFVYFKDGNIPIDEVLKAKEKSLNLVPVLNKKEEIVKVYDFNKIKSVLPVDFVIMAGGRGERMRPMTDSTPKPLLKLGGKPIIEYSIDSAIDYGIENIFITVNYLSEQIDHFVESYTKGARIKTIKEPSKLGTIGSITLIDHFQNDSILVMNSDLFTNIDLEEFYLHFIKEKADLSIASVPYNIDLPYAILEENQGEVQSLKEKPSFTYYSNAGIYFIKKEILAYIPNDRFFNATDLIAKLIEIGKRVTQFPIIGYWIDIGKPEDFKKAEEYTKYL